VLQKAYMFFTIQSLFSALAAVWSVNAHGSNDTLPYCQSFLFLNLNHLLQIDTEATSSKKKLRKYESAIDTSCAFEANDLNLRTGNFDSMVMQPSSLNAYAFLTKV
jgi:hypothetical protein